MLSGAALSMMACSSGSSSLPVSSSASEGPVPQPLSADVARDIWAGLFGEFTSAAEVEVSAADDIDTIETLYGSGDGCAYSGEAIPIASN
jgi:hypothetical protein